MGNDGGTIISRRDIMVKKRKKLPHQEMEPSEVTTLQWSTCCISKQPLDPQHIVCCRMGFLYNKDSFLEQLIKNRKRYREHVKRVKAGEMKASDYLHPSNFGGPFDHLLSKDDVVDVHFELNHGASSSGGSGDGGNDATMIRSQFVCPITQREIRSPHSFYLMRRCGHVVSEKALLQMPSTSSSSHGENHVATETTCLVCNDKYVAGDGITVLNPPADMEKKLRKTVTRDILDAIARELQDDMKKSEQKKQSKKKRKKSQQHAEESHAKKRTKKETSV